MPSTDHYVIIGNGPAGNQAALTLRKLDEAAKITIISGECVPFYSKPKLTGFIRGEVGIDELTLTSLEDYDKNNIRVRLGQTVERIDPENNAIFLYHMEKINYTGLIVASGSCARILPNMLPYAQHLHFVTSYTDVMEIKEKIAEKNDFFVFGGDLVAFRFMRMLKSMGKNTGILIYPNAFWPYNLNEDMLERITASLSGITDDIIVKDDIETIEKQGESYVLTTRKGVQKIVDLVFSFNGMLPNIDFAQGCGLDTDHGILVDEYLKTNVDNIYAAGSCAQIYNPQIKSYTVSIGWPNAVAQGEVAAHNIAGGLQKIDTVGRKYFDLEGVKIKTTWWGDLDEES